MSTMITPSFGSRLPYSSLFSVPPRNTFESRSSDLFWHKAISTDTSSIDQSDENWLNDPDSSSWVDEDQFPSSARRPLKKKRFTKIRQIAFQSFAPKSFRKKPTTVVVTEAISEQRRGSRLSVLTSLHFKSRGDITRVSKLVKVVRHRISSKSPEHRRPKTWEEYNHLYSTEQIDINNPPLPPTESNPENPTPYETGVYCPPLAKDESTRQLVLNRLALCGKGGIDPSDEANMRARARTKLAVQLEQKGTAPDSLDEEWYRRSAGSSLAELESSENHFETLEQHPVFRKIVNKLCQIFGTAHSLISILEENQQLFLAVSGDNDGRIAPRDTSMCTHTVLSGRKAFVILDASQDFRFKNGPLAVHWGTRFYAGAPLLSPRFGTDREGASFPIGTLCIIDPNPRTQFGIEERKKLIYMAEYARIELEKWFLKKIERKVKLLWDSRMSWAREIEQLVDYEDVVKPSGRMIEPQPRPEDSSPPTSKLQRKLFKNRSTTALNSGSSDISTPPISPMSMRSKHGSFLGFARSVRSDISTPPVSPYSVGHSPVKPILASLPEDCSLFDKPELNPKLQTILDRATKLVGNTLDLSLVYLLAVESHPHSLDTGRTRVISSHNLPSPAPLLDAGIHLRALFSLQGGLLCQNASAQEAQDAGLTAISKTGSARYTSAILMAVGPYGPSVFKGFVLAGFTSDLKRVFGDEDVNYMRDFSNDLARFTSHLKL